MEQRRAHLGLRGGAARARACQALSPGLPPLFTAGQRSALQHSLALLWRQVRAASGNLKPPSTQTAGSASAPSATEANLPPLAAPRVCRAWLAQPMHKTEQALRRVGTKWG